MFGVSYFCNRRMYTLEPCVHECVRHLSRTVFIPTYIQWCDIIPPWLDETLEPRATFEPLTGPKGLREPEATLEPRVHECVRHSSRTVLFPTYIQWCDIIPPWLGKEHSNRVRHSNHSQARRALGCRRPHSNRASKNIIGSTKYRKAQRQERIHRRNHSQEVTRQEHRIISSFFCVSY